MKDMKKHQRGRGIRLALLPLALFLAGEAGAVEYWLCVKKTSKVMPDTSEAIPMWGYALETDNDFTNGCQGRATVPGPRLNVSHLDSTLTVHLYNDLGGLPYSENVSIVIPGLTATMTPEFVTDAQGRERVNSLTNSVAPGTSATFTWSNVKPGTFLYHSGTHPQVQVPMGLYGPMTRNYRGTQIYQGVPFDSQRLVLFSEIDPVYNKAIYNGRFGTPSPSGETDPNYPSSALSYVARYFLINGRPYPNATPISAVAGEATLLRFLNASLNTRVPVLQGTPYMSMVGEDGNKLPYAQPKYNIFLPAMKTMDVMVTPTEPGSFPLYDRRLGLTNNNFLGGGMLTYLNVTAP